MDVIPTITVKPSKIVFYNQFIGYSSGHPSKSTWTENFKDNSTKGIISNTAQKNIRNSIDWLIFLSPYKKVYNKAIKKYFRFKINFITLTLPAHQSHADQFIKAEMLNHFLQMLRYRHGMKFYLWRAEAQKNGNIHFHITTNVFVEWWLVRKYWNKILDKHGYIKHYSNNQKKYFAKGFKMSENKKDKRSFIKQYKSYIWNSIIDWQNPNTTDIHSVKNIRNLSAYLSKYMTKNSTERPIEGRLWYMSTELSKLRHATDEIHDELSNELSILVEYFADKYKVYDHASVLYLSYKDWKNFPVPHLRNLFQDYFNETMYQINFKL